MRRYLVAGNWKMNGNAELFSELLSGVVAGSASISDVDWVVCPPFVYLSEVAETVKDTSLQLSAQSVSSNNEGAYTGDISASMLKEVGCQYSLVGHSERRTLFGVTNQDVATKVNLLLNNKINPIICVGETLEERESGITERVVKEQLAVALSLHDNLHALYNVVIAYEPVWAIGTGNTAKPEQVEQVHAAIRQALAEIDEMLALNVRIIYGGSVTPETASGLFEMENIDGALVGGASLVAEKFIAIGKQCIKFS